MRKKQIILFFLLITGTFPAAFATGTDTIAATETTPVFANAEDETKWYVARSVRYPRIAWENGIEGTVVVSFVVETDGRITNAEVVKSVDKYLDEEALRVITSLPHYPPAKENGKPVRKKMTFPVQFKLEHDQ